VSSVTSAIQQPGEQIASAQNQILETSSVGESLKNQFKKAPAINQEISAPIPIKIATPSIGIKLPQNIITVSRTPPA
jgi:hypothetical protein